MAQREKIYENEIYKLSYERLYPTLTNTLIFLHGWGSNKEIMKNSFSKEFDEYSQIYIDLPGFGNSSIANRVLNTQDYANIVQIFLNSLHVKTFCIFGHSFGGKVATLLNPSRLVLLSTAGILEKKSLKVRAKIKVFKMLKQIMPKRFFKYFISDDVKNMNRSMYEVLKKVVNEDFSEIFSKRENETHIYWGSKDKATALCSGQKIHSLIKNSTFVSYEGDHFFFTKFAKDIALDFKKRVG